MTLDETCRLEASASATKVSLATALYTAVLLSLSKEFLLDDVSVLMAHAARTSPSLKMLGAGTVGVFLLRTAVNRAMTLGEFTRSVQNKVIRGAINSRPPYTYARVITQLAREATEAARTDAQEISAPSRVHLCVVDATTIRRDLDSPIPGLSVERVLPGFSPKERFELSGEGAPFPGRALGILLRRDISREQGQPVSFVCAFHTACVEENIARAFVNRVADVCRRMTAESQQRPLGELLS